ncbi:HlyC/CorC family transporter [Nocardiopsis sp. HNM0947]|uniref:HlyC/CorC family transporter n=1 Tax=Nocardiopsis coralli TaxID=2772213 RepID=A0ABR9PCM5_9ACTN|nr:hemolysin family protein [Nocardiopsis coralli]MBE3001601.1 HlyC/CorC family transporter [Nocardiopsis coralli]
MSAAADIALGVLVIVVVTAGTGYFVAQQFCYTAVDRSRVRAGSARGDRAMTRVARITERTSFTLSGAQLGITVTTLVVGFAAEPLLGSGLGRALGAAGLPEGAGPAVGAALALSFSTVVQMVFGELLPKNLAIARPEPVARALSWSARLYLVLFGWLVRLFDRAAGLLLRLVGVEHREDVDSSATPDDLSHILAESRRSGDLSPQLYTQLTRALEFHERTAEHAMTPRAAVHTVGAGEPLERVVAHMARARSRFPVLREGDVAGVVCLRDVLAVPDPGSTRAEEIARPAVLVPASLELPEVLAHLRGPGEEFACVLDEYGGLAGVLTLEDLAEELVGEIADEFTPEPVTAAPLVRPGFHGAYRVPGSLHIDEAERLLGQALPPGRHETVGGLAVQHLHRLPRAGDQVRLELEGTGDGPPAELVLVVETVEHHVPGTVELLLRRGDRAEVGA